MRFLTTYKTCLLVILLIAATQFSFAQNQMHMAQYMLHQQFINPGTLGSYEQLTVGLFHRNQWVKFEGAPKVTGLTVSSPIGQHNKSHISLNVLHDRIGIDQTTEIGLNYAYRLQIGLHSHLALGAGGSINTVQSDFSMVNTTDSDDPMFAGNSPTYVLPNAKFGAYYFKRKWYVGFAIPQLLQNKITTNGTSYAGATNFSGANLHYYLHAGYEFKLNEDFDLNVSTLLKETSASPFQVDLNAQVVYHEVLGFGASYRTSQELFAMVNYKILDTWKIGYAYEFNMGRLGKYSTGTHEIILIYQFNPPKEPIVAVPRF
jgi:type IX secretion system PorP/SprF family membrane protein